MFLLSMKSFSTLLTLTAALSPVIAQTAQSPDVEPTLISAPAADTGASQGLDLIQLASDPKYAPFIDIVRVWFGY
jgi:hypothetical protein